MKLVEVIILAGTHCISPLQHADGITDAAKVSCAVIVEKDTEANTVSVMPPWQAEAPEVRVALGGARPGAAASAGNLRIEPAAAGPEPITAPPEPPGLTAKPADTPPGGQDAEPATGEQPSSAQVDSANQPEAADTTAAPAAEQQPQDEPPAITAPGRKVKAQDRPVRVADASPPPSAGKSASARCSGSAQPVWYTNKDGHRKYRCTTPGKAPGKASGKAKLY